MSENLVNLFTAQYGDAILLKLQQRQSKLRGRVMEGNHVGKMAAPVQYVGAIEMKAPAGRFAPLQRQDADEIRRWVFPVDKEATQMVDNFDKLKAAVDPQSQEVEAGSAAANREYDDRIIAAAFGTAYTGVDAGSLSTETWSSISTPYTIAANFNASGAVGCTVDKMREAKRIFRKNQVDVETEQLTWITNSMGESDLLGQATVTSLDFNERPVLVNGVVTRFMGFDIIYSERLSSNGSTRKNIALCKSGAYLGVWKDMGTNITQRTDLSSQPWQIYQNMSSGATRLEPGRLLEVDCADSSAAADVTP